MNWLELVDLLSDRISIAMKEASQRLAVAYLTSEILKAQSSLASAGDDDDKVALAVQRAERIIAEIP